MVAYVGTFSVVDIHVLIFGDCPTRCLNLQDDLLFLNRAFSFFGSVSFSGLKIAL